MCWSKENSFEVQTKALLIKRAPCHENSLPICTVQWNKLYRCVQIKAGNNAEEKPRVSEKSEVKADLDVSLLLCTQTINWGYRSCWMNINFILKPHIHICVEQEWYDSCIPSFKISARLSAVIKAVPRKKTRFYRSTCAPVGREQGQFYSVARHLNCSRSTNTLSIAHWGEARPLLPLYVVGAEAKCLTNNTSTLERKRKQKKTGSRSPVVVLRQQSSFSSQRRMGSEIITLRWWMPEHVSFTQRKSLQRGTNNTGPCAVGLSPSKICLLGHYVNWFGIL